MKTDSERRFDDFTVRQAFYKSIPVLAGYVVIGIGFGPMRRSSADMEAQFSHQHSGRHGDRVKADPVVKLPHFIKFKGDQAK